MIQTNQWEYRLESFGTFWNRPDDEALKATLDEWGEDGWEVIKIWKSGSGEKVTLIAKRPLERTTRRKRSWPG